MGNDGRLEKITKVDKSLTFQIEGTAGDKSSLLYTSQDNHIKIFLKRENLNDKQD